jgi:hypothetical protein
MKRSVIKRLIEQEWFLDILGSATIILFFVLSVPIVISIAGTSLSYTADNKFDLFTFGNGTDSNFTQRFVGGEAIVGRYNTSTDETGRFGLPDLDPVRAVGAVLSSNLSAGIVFQVNTLPSVNLSATGNNGTSQTQFNVTISSEGTNVDLYIKGDSNLTSGSNFIVLRNEVVSFNVTDNTVPRIAFQSLTTNFSNTPIGTNLADGSVVHIKFYLNVSGAQAAGTYHNNVSFKVVPTGEIP